jgi:hypothetical protein
MRQAVGFRDRTTVDAQKMVAQLDLAQHAVLIKVLKHKHRSDIHRHAKSNVLSFYLAPSRLRYNRRKRKAAYGLDLRFDR